MDQQTMIFWSKVVSNVLLFTIIVTFIVGALIKRVNVYEAFIGGAKTGFETSVKVMPYLVGMLVAIGVLRDSGALDFCAKGGVSVSLSCRIPILSILFLLRS